MTLGALEVSFFTLYCANWPIIIPSQPDSTTYDVCRRVRLPSRLRAIVPAKNTGAAYTSGYSRLMPTVFFQ